MSDIYSVVAFQPPGPADVAASIHGKLLGTNAQKSNPALVSNAHKQVQMQIESVRDGEYPTTRAVLILQFDFARSAADDLAQFLTIT